MHVFQGACRACSRTRQITGEAGPRGLLVSGCPRGAFYVDFVWGGGGVSINRRQTSHVSTLRRFFKLAPAWGPVKGGPSLPIHPGSTKDEAQGGLLKGGDEAAGPSGPHVDGGAGHGQKGGYFQAGGTQPRNRAQCWASSVEREGY